MTRTRTALLAAVLGLGALGAGTAAAQEAPPAPGTPPPHGPEWDPQPDPGPFQPGPDPAPFQPGYAPGTADLVDDALAPVVTRLLGGLLGR